MHKVERLGSSVPGTQAFNPNRTDSFAVTTTEDFDDASVVGRAIG